MSSSGYVSPSELPPVLQRVAPEGGITTDAYEQLQSGQVEAYVLAGRIAAWQATAPSKATSPQW